MSENVPYKFSGCSEGVPSFSNGTRDDTMGATCSIEKGREGGLLEDIFQVLSKVPLHECLEASTSKNEECFMQEKQGIESHHYTSIVAQGSQIDEGTEAKEETSAAHTPPYDESHIPIRRRNREQRRRARINVKLRALQATLPSSSGKKDHASILHNATNYINSLKRQVEVLSSARLTEPTSEHQASYNPPMNVGGTSFINWPVPFPIGEPFNYLRMIQPNFPIRPVPQFPFTPLFAPQLLPQPQPSAPIRFCPPNPNIGLENSSMSQATTPSTMGKSSGLYSETNPP